jgi:hypothetical protein
MLVTLVAGIGVWIFFFRRVRVLSRLMVESRDSASLNTTVFLLRCVAELHAFWGLLLISTGSLICGVGWHVVSAYIVLQSSFELASAAMLPRFLHRTVAVEFRSALFVRASIWRAELIDYDKIPCNFHG